MTASLRAESTIADQLTRATTACARAIEVAEAAVQTLETVAGLAGRPGAARVAKLREDLDRARRVAPGPDPRPPAVGLATSETTPVVLSAREHDVLRRAAEGCSTDEIGAQLYLAPDTVKSHLRKAFRKLGATGRANAVHLAHQQGLL